MIETIAKYRLRSNEQEMKGRLYVMVAIPTLLEKIIEVQKSDQEVLFVKSQLEDGVEMPNWSVNMYGSLRYQDRVFIPNSDQLRE